MNKKLIIKLDLIKRRKNSTIEELLDNTILKKFNFENRKLE